MRYMKGMKHNWTFTDQRMWGYDFWMYQTWLTRSHSDSTIPGVTSKPYALFAADIILLFIIISLAVHYVQRRNKLAPLPPGPRPLPIVGNIWDFPTTHEGRFYTEHKELYGMLPISCNIEWTNVCLMKVRSVLWLLSELLISCWTILNRRSKC